MGSSFSGLKITATVSGTNQYGVPTSALASRTFSVGAFGIYFENGTCKCEGVSAGATATINGIMYTAVDNSTIGWFKFHGNVNLCTSNGLISNAFIIIILLTLI